MKLLVTGLSGLVGTRFQSLYQHSHEFISLDLTNGVDITDQSQVMEKVAAHPDADAIIHLAAYTNVSDAAKQQGDKTGPAYQVNVVGTKNIIAAANAYQKYLIHISTDYVFDGNKSDAYTEIDTPHPIEWYGQTKLWAEDAVRELSAKYIILRLSFPYQAQPSRPDFLAKIIENLRKNTLPPPFTDHILTPTFVDDVAHVFNYCISNQPMGLYHMVGSSSHSDYEIALMVKEHFNLHASITPGSLEEYLKQTNRPYQQTMKVSNTKLTKDFGISMHTLPEGLAVVKSQLLLI